MRRLLLLLSTFCILNTFAANIASLTVVQAEYFIDIDPGVGAAVSLPISSGDSVLVNASISLVKLSQGFHILCIRFKDSNGHWGLTESRTFFVNLPVSNAKSAITASEYFFDTDPGPGLGKPVSVNSADSVLINSTAAIKGLGTGFHILGFRIRDAFGKWSLNESRSFYVNNNSNTISQISAGEYFFDTDPGVGLGKSLTLSSADSVLINTSITSSGLKPGFHTLVTRFKNSNGHWGLNEARGFYINNGPNPPAQITSAEYFFDTDPGVGKGKKLPLSQADSIALNTLISNSGLANGFHILGLRFKDGNGHYGLTEARKFKICYQVPKADFSFAPNTNSISFTNLSTNGLVYSWQFKDGSTDTAYSPVHVYKNTGTYNVCLATKNACTTDTMCKIVSLKTCTPNFYPDGFYDNFQSSTSPINPDYSGIYYFGEANLGNPTHPNFQAAYVRNTNTKTLDVKINQGTGELYPFGITFGDTQGNNNGTPYYMSLVDKTFSVVLSNKSTSQALKIRVQLVDVNNRVIDTYKSALKDSTGFANADHYAIEKTVPQNSTVLFSGDFSKGMYANPNTSQFDTLFDFTKIKAINFIALSPVNIGPPSYAHQGLVDLPLSILKIKIGAVSTVSALPVGNTNICNGGTVNLNAGGATNYSWSPITGLSASNIPNPIASPVVSTTYRVKGVAAGCTTFDSVKVNVVPIPNSSFSFTNNAITNTIDFKVAMVAPKIGYYWDFGDNLSTTNPNPTHTFNGTGNYLVSLKVLDSTSLTCPSGSTSNYIPVGAGGCLTKAVFSFKKDSLSTLVTFSDASVNASAWYWDYGNGAFSAAQNNSYTYPAAGNYNVCLTVRDTANGCQNSLCKAINIGTTVSACQTKFNYFTDGIGDKIQFDGKSFNSPTVKYYWAFGNGDYSVLPRPAYTFTNAGYTNVCLYTVDTITKCQSNYCENIHVGGGDCKAKFSAAPEASTSAVNFQDQSIGEPLSWYWDFGDGIVNSLQNPRHIYAAAGYYKVCLTTKNKTGCQNTYCNYVQAGSGNCQTNFTYFVDPVKRSIDLRDLSSGSPVNWFWSFGDGSNAPMQNPSHTFLTDGVYSVCLYSNNAGNCLSHLCQDITIGKTKQNCVAYFEGFISGKTASFKNKSISGNANTYFWDFGDQSYATDENPTHTFPADGYYVVTFTLYNQTIGCFNTTYKTVVVGNASTVKCKAAYSSISNDSTYVVTFKDESVGIPVKWEWKFPDGSTSTLQNPVHKFAKPDFYEVCLTVKSANGSSSFFCNYVGIGQKGLKALYTYESDTVYFKNDAVYPVSFYGSAYGKPTKWKWNFGDNTSDSLRINVVHNYNLLGSYKACLTVSDPQSNLTSFYCRLIKVNATTSVKENSKDALDLNIYPNPLINKATVSYSLLGSQHVELTLLDLQGNKIKTLVNESQQDKVRQVIDITDCALAQGMYIIQLNVNGQSYYKPVIISK